MRSKNVLYCKEEKDCLPCVQVQLDMSVASLTEKLEDLTGDDCGDEEEESDEDQEEGDEEEDEEIVNSDHSSGPDHRSNGSFICANLFISQMMPTSSYCDMVRVWMPLSSVPRYQGMNSVKVGTVVFNCFLAAPGDEVNLTSYTQPRYHDVLSKTHHVRDCKKLRVIEEVKQCQVPSLNVSIGDEISVGILNGSRDRGYFLKLYHNRTYQQNNLYRISQRNGEDRYVVPASDVVPCLCFQVWLSNLTDAVRQSQCPFLKYHQYEENVWRQSDLSLKMQNERLVYEFTAPCDLAAEVTLCWKSSHPSQCLEIPDSRRQIFVQDPRHFKKVRPHSSLCVQVRNKDNRIWHTKCPHAADSQNSKKRKEVLVTVSRLSRSNSSLCLLETNPCTALFSFTDPRLKGDRFLKQKVMQDLIANQCVKIWSPSENREVFVCSLDKYMRQRWSLAWVLCLCIPSCVLLLLVLKKVELQNWVKLVTEDTSLDEIFRCRRVLILYSPDYPAYEQLVGTLASSLNELRLTVILDQWHSVEMSNVSPIPWYHGQKSLVCEQNGLILLLFSEGARNKYYEWMGETTQERASGNPYSSFEAALNCVLPDFDGGTLAGRYVVACFEDGFNRDDIPKIFQEAPVLSLPSQLARLLVELAGDSKRKLKKRQLHKLSTRVSEKLQNAIQRCQQNGYHPANQSDGQISVSLDANGNDSLELYRLL
ncbi:hypothetical protein FKM82_004495 [Ascaphus truei]